LVRQTDIQRALTALVSNAIKYSYTLEGEKRAWLDISVGTNSNVVWAKIESWGVPIAQFELERGTIFEPGQRGKHALISGRIGGGIGLWDAKKVATSHGGDIEVSSRATTQKSSQTMPPYVTTAVLSLPLINKTLQKQPQYKPINSGQERTGKLLRDGDDWFVIFEGDERRARVENEIPASNELAEGTKVLVYVSHQSRIQGIRVRVVRLLD
jgi:anti-sigma regulatory factor (Ser/Thr protein kinase)